MVIYRFTLNYDSTDYVLADNEQPKNFATIKSRIKRDFRTHGTFYSFTDGDLNLEFPGTGRDVLKEAFETEGIDAVVTLTVERQRQNEPSFTTIFTGQANFANYQLLTDYVSIDFEDISIQSKVMARSGVKYDTSRTTNLEGGTIAPSYSSFNYESLILYEQSESDSFNLYEINTSTAQDAVDITLSTGSTQRDEISTNASGDTSVVILPNLGIGDSIPFTTFDDGTTSFEGYNTGVGFRFDPVKGVDSYEVDLEVDIELDAITSGTIGTSSSCEQGLIIYEQEPDLSLDLTEVDLSGQILTSGNTNVNYTQSKTITVGSRTVFVYIAYKVITVLDPGVSSGSFQIVVLSSEPTKYTATYESTYPDTIINGQLIHEALDKNLEYITGEQNFLYSDFFGRTDIGYNVDGCAGLFMETNGYNIRADRRGIIGSLKGRLDSLNAILNIGHGVQFTDYDKDVYQYRVEPSEYFYQDAELVSFQDIENNSYSERYFPDLQFNELEFGYSKFAEGDESPASLLDWFTQGVWSLPVGTIPQKSDQGIAKTYSMISDYVVSPYVWERTRRVQFDIDPTKTSKNDKDLFLVQLQDNYPNYIPANTVNVTGGGELFDQPFAVRASYFNYLFRPIYNVINHGFIVNSAMFTKPNTAVVRNSSYELNDNLIYVRTLDTCIGNDVSYKNDDDIIRSQMEGGSALFDPILINFKVAMSVEQANEIILGHQNGLNAKNYGYISVVNPDGETKQGWVMDLVFSPVDNIGEFTLLKKA